MASTAPREFRLVFERRRPPVRSEDLLTAVQRAVDLLQAEDATLFRLSGYSPSMERIPVSESGVSRVEKFLSTSDIEWNFGREPADPTHEVLFFNEHEDARRITLRVAFFLEGEECTAPGVGVVLRLGADAEGDLASGRIDRLFRLLAEALTPDSGRVESPNGKVLRELSAPSADRG